MFKSLITRLERRAINWLLPHIVVAVDQEVTKQLVLLRDEVEEHVDNVIPDCVEEAINNNWDEKFDEKFEELDFEDLVEDQVRNSKRIIAVIKDEARDALDGENLADALCEWIQDHPEAADAVAKAILADLPGVAQAI